MQIVWVYYYSDSEALLFFFQILDPLLPPSEIPYLFLVKDALMEIINDNSDWLQGEKSRG